MGDVTTSALVEYQIGKKGNDSHREFPLPRQTDSHSGTGSWFIAGQRSRLWIKLHIVQSKLRNPKQLRIAIQVGGDCVTKANHDLWNEKCADKRVTKQFYKHWIDPRNPQHYPSLDRRPDLKFVTCGAEWIMIKGEGGDNFFLFFFISSLDEWIWRLVITIIITIMIMESDSKPIHCLVKVNDVLDWFVVAHVEWHLKGRSYFVPHSSIRILYFTTMEWTNCRQNN